MGGNLGDPAGVLRAAVIELASLGRVAAVSRVYETDPVGYHDQPPFLNAVAGLDTELSPEALLERLLVVVWAAGRRRRGVRWGPRTLDLDLLWYEGEQRADPRLMLPHPRAHEREFVLRPLAELDPALRLAGRTVAELLRDLPPQGVRLTDLRLMDSPG
ncbi:MAG: 2-amino-4-hydroxy-6-hydroxymethyldihydropteridine diphosphokinase [Gaiellales bacterium]